MIKPEFSKENPNYLGWTDIDYPTFKTIENQNLVVLIDSYVASAGESFVHYLQSLKNLILIGTNTSGIGNIGNQGIHILPYSKIKFNFGMSLSVDSDLIWREGLGCFPDFWIPSSDALNRTLKFISYYSR